MQFLKIGPIKIPYVIKKENERKVFEICGIKIPFSTYLENGRKVYCIFGIKIKLSNIDNLFLSQSKLNYMEKDRLDDAKVKEIAVHIFEEKLGYTPNLDHPQSMNEKIFWMKLHYHNPLVTKCCDKFAVKEYVAEKWGDGHTIPTIQSWNSADEIDFSVLPEKFVLKVNWSSGYNIIVKNKEELDQEKARETVRHWMLPQQNSYYQTFNWGYKKMQPIVYAEQYMEQIDGQLYDYKFYCCNGKAKFLFIATNRHEEGKLTYDFFDMDFNHLNLHYGGRAHSDKVLHKPRFYEEMIRSAELLAEPFPFVRVDFYETSDRFYVGEMTFYSGGGILPFEPREWDYKLGDLIDISNK